MGAGFNLVIRNDTDPDGTGGTFKLEVNARCVEHADRISASLAPGQSTGGYFEAENGVFDCLGVRSKLSITVVDESAGRAIVGLIARDFNSDWEFIATYAKDSHGKGGWGRYKIINEYSNPSNGNPENHVRIIGN